MNNIIDILEKMLDKEEKKPENEHKHITYLRRKVLEKAKEKGLIKDYKPTTTRKPNKKYFGSLVGWDKMFEIIL